MKVLVCGSRTWTDEGAVRRRLAELPPDAVILHGGARGADAMAARAAADLGLQVRAYPADWGRHGRAAGLIRNVLMLDEGPDLVIAFQRDRSRGTEHTVTEARRRGVPVEVVAS